MNPDHLMIILALAGWLACLSGLVLGALFALGGAALGAYFVFITKRDPQEFSWPQVAGFVGADKNSGAGPVNIGDDLVNTGDRATEPVISPEADAMLRTAASRLRMQNMGEAQP